MLFLVITPWLRRTILGVPGVPVVRALCFYCRGHGFNPGWGMKIPQTMWHVAGKFIDCKMAWIISCPVSMPLAVWDSVALPIKRLNLFLNSLNSGLSCDMICPEEWDGRDGVTVTSLGLKTSHIALLALETLALPWDKLASLPMDTKEYGMETNKLSWGPLRPADSLADGR